MSLQILRGDIVNMNTDAIVNAANSALQAGGGVCGAIFRVAGPRDLREACNAIGHCAPGQSVITPGFALKSAYIIHTVGPIWQGGDHHEETQLRNCYRSALDLAKENGLTSIAFPLISSGIYGYPKDQALKVATETINEFLLIEDMDITLVVFDKAAFQLSQKLVDDVRQYIDDHYSEAIRFSESSRKLNQNDLQSEENETNYESFQDKIEGPTILYNIQESIKLSGVEDFLKKTGETFTTRLLRFIDERGLTDANAYHKANISRQVFSTIRNKTNYQPKKETILAFCIALELDLTETLELLKTAGYTLSDCKQSDLIVQYFIEQREYNIHLVNQTLFKFDQKLLGV
jgi:O-acetyl-ADP-ribose deacetylase (regulator of RNase III)